MQNYLPLDFMYLCLEYFEIFIMTLHERDLFLDDRLTLIDFSYVFMHQYSSVFDLSVQPRFVGAFNCIDAIGLICKAGCIMINAMLAAAMGSRNLGVRMCMEPN